METTSTSKTAASLYLDLPARCLHRTLFADEVVPVQPQSAAKTAALSPLAAITGTAGMELLRRRRVDLAVREKGEDWPFDAETMVGLKRLDNIHEAIRTVIEEDVPGDWLETGVWRGGASIFARACLAAYGDDHRIVCGADSFEGLPKPSLPQDEGDMLWSYDELAVDVESVRQNFVRYGLCDDRVRFLIGWFA